MEPVAGVDDRRCLKCGSTENTYNATRCIVCGHSLPLAQTRATARHSAYVKDFSRWRRYLLCRLDAEPIELEMGKPFTFGRSRDCDLVIQSTKISRRHAQVVWKKDKPLLRDLGSENGTEVNGKQLRVDHPLAHEDELVMGPFSCVFRIMSGQGSVQAEQGLLDSQADTQAMQAVAMTGDLEEMSVYEVLETLTYNKKTGMLTLYSPYDVEGTIALRDGQLIQAKVEGFRGEQAVFSLVAWTEGRFRFVVGIEPDLRRNIRRPAEELLAEIAKQNPGGGLSAGDYS